MRSLNNLGNFLRTLATPERIKDWSLTSLKSFVPPKIAMNKSRSITLTTAQYRI
jgi:hypothetical protein